MKCFVNFVKPTGQHTLLPSLKRKRRKPKTDILKKKRSSKVNVEKITMEDMTRNRKSTPQILLNERSI